jgi:hypothetical protein
MCTASDEPLPMIEQIRRAFDILDSLEETLEGFVDNDMTVDQVKRHLFFVREFFSHELSIRERELLMRLKKDESV